MSKFAAVLDNLCRQTLHIEEAPQINAFGMWLLDS